MPRKKKKNGALDPASKKLRLYMIEEGISVSDVAHRTGWSVSYVSMILRGNRLNAAARRDVAQALRKDPRAIWG